MFNLNAAITEWRHQMLAAGIKTPVPLDELESHLRDDVAHQMNLGSNAQQAFEGAVSRIGPAGALKHEFMKDSEIRQILRQKVLWIAVGAGLLGCGVGFRQAPAVALVYGILMAGLIIAAFIDFKHYIIPDEITIGGILVGLASSFLLPQLHGQKLLVPALLQSLLGIAIGGGLLYFVLRAGKMALGRERLILAGGAKISLTDTALLLPDKEILYQDLFYRKSDAIELKAESVDLNGRSYQNVPVRLTPTSLQIGDNLFGIESVSHVETVSTEVVLPREVMGLGDVKFMAAIGAFLGWQAVVFSLVLSSCLGSMVGLGLIAARRCNCSSRLPFGPYLAAGAAIWIFGGKHWFKSLFIQ